MHTGALAILQTGLSVGMFVPPEHKETNQKIHLEEMTSMTLSMMYKKLDINYWGEGGGGGAGQTCTSISCRVLKLPRAS